MAVDRSLVPALGPTPAFRFPELVTHPQPNGVMVRTIEHATVPLVTMVVLVPGGSSVDPEGLSGLTALTADMLDEGIKDLDAIEVSDRLARIGAHCSAQAGPDATTLTLSVLERHAAEGVELLAELVRRPSMRDEDFQRVRQQRVTRIRQLRDVPSAVADRAFLKRVYGNHPYGRLSLGDEAGLAAVTSDDVMACHAAMYRPERTVVLLGGAMSHDGLARLAGLGFGDWSAGATRAVSDELDRRFAVRPAEPASSLTVVARHNAPQSQLRVGLASVPRATRDYAALTVMNAVLGGEFTSRLNLRLREEKAVTYGARTGFDWRRGPSPFMLRTSVDVAATAEAVEDTLHEFEDMRGSRPVTADELHLAKASLTRGFAREYETVDQVVRAAAQLALYGLPDNTFETFIPSIDMVKPADVTRVASDLLPRAHLSVLVVGDPDVVAGPLGSLGFGVPEIEASDAASEGVRARDEGIESRDRRRDT